jgi:uncharacterized damage-inducible protein DinB
MGKKNMNSLAAIFDGWNGYQTGLVNAISPLTSEQLSWRPTPESRSVGAIARHIGLGRIAWFERMDAPGSKEVICRIEHWEVDNDGNREIVEDLVASSDHADELVTWLQATWQMIDKTLSTWKVSDLSEAYQHIWNEKTYLVSRQWTIWHVLSHDLHHGGELSLMLGLQGIHAFELSSLFGHITLPPLAEEL